MLNRQTFYNQELAELHVHVGGSIDPAIMWSIAHEQGIRLPTKNFWQFNDMMSIKNSLDWENFHKMFALSELIQSSPQAMERCVHEIIGGAYRHCNITLIEVSFNPMARNRGGERDLDHIILASLHGMERALIEYPQVKAGLIFFLDRRLSIEKNSIILEKAIKYKNRGIVGIDFAGPNPANAGFSYKPYKDLYLKARQAGLSTCVHAGEEGEAEEMLEAIEYLLPDRIVHGVKGYKSREVLTKLAKSGTVLAVCPTSNLKIGIVKDLKELKAIFEAFKKYRVKFCINTDDPEFLLTDLLGEYKLLLSNNILTKEDLLVANRVAFENTFIR